MGGPVGLHLEVKRYKRIVSYDWMIQAVEDSNEGEIPVVLSRQDGGEWCVTLRMEDSVDFARRLIGHMDESEGALS